MYLTLFREFVMSGDTLRVFEGDYLVFSSSEDGLLPLVEYIERSAPSHRQIAVFDRIMGNAAALLAIKAGGNEVYSPLGSQIAVKTLASYGIKYHLDEVVPYIQKLGGEGICPMEKLSVDKGPEEFYQAVRSIVMRRTGNSG